MFASAKDTLRSIRTALRHVAYGGRLLFIHICLYIHHSIFTVRMLAASEPLASWISTLDSAYRRQFAAEHEAVICLHILQKFTIWRTPLVVRVVSFTHCRSLLVQAPEPFPI